MELNKNTAVISAMEVLSSTMQEQGVELDYVLPDYFPDVCKLVKCMLTPTIVSQSVSRGLLTYELRADIRILYCAEDSHVLQCVTQTLHFSRTAELPAEDQVTAELCPVTDYVNCRVVSRRRLDVRGAVTIRIRPTVCRQQEVLRDLPDRSIQLRRIPVEYPAQQLRTEKTIVLSEELELGSAKPPVLHIVRCEARSVEESHKLISGKLMVQGSLRIQLLYACEKDGDGSLEPMTFRIPYSQMMELEGMEEQDSCAVTVRVTGCELKSIADAAGDTRVLRCEAELCISCTALRMATESLVCDAFSTEHPCICEDTRLAAAGVPVPVSAMLPQSVRLTCEDGTFDCVHDAWCEVKNLTARPDPDSGTVQVSGMLCCSVLVRETGGMPRLLEREEPFEHRIPVEGICAEDCVYLMACAENCTYTLSEGSEVSLKTELHIGGTLRHSCSCRVLTDVSVQPEITHPRDFALKLYFGHAQEEIWDIAKRCHTSVEAIMEENDLTDEVLRENSMLLIPIVG